ncbi:MAG: cell division inhibitor SidA [Caulobacterales bacterium]|nr:cell division inhibitor SidA [Caulobacterales bacterium]
MVRVAYEFLSLVSVVSFVAMVCTVAGHVA